MLSALLLQINKNNSSNNNANNKWSVLDGALVKINQNGANDFNINGSGHILRVASKIAGEPAQMRLGRGMSFGGNDNEIRLESGGVMDCAANMNINDAGNKITLEGGQLFCDTLVINSGNALNASLTPAGILPVVAAASATFALGAKISVSSPDGTTGRFAILKAPAINIPVPLDDKDFFDAPENFACKLDLVEGEEGQTLWLSLHKRGSFFMLR
ncbi:MAG: hypothetical protein FWF96_06275 [Kiritimatiellaeota bacterium]|nr:hypothetical protein [Kiritimatiellota bacterium]